MQIISDIVDDNTKQYSSDRNQLTRSQDRTDEKHREGGLLQNEQYVVCHKAGKQKKGPLRSITKLRTKNLHSSCNNNYQSTVKGNGIETSSKCCGGR